MQEQIRTKENSGIYQILNTVNNKTYIGSSIRLHERYIKHKNDLDGNRHINKHLQASYNKYGRNVFLFKILKLCQENDFMIQEQFFVVKCNSNNPKFGYNKRIIAESNRGHHFKMPESAKENLRIIGKKRGATKKFKQMMSSIHKGKKVSQETKTKSSISHLGYKVKEETKLKISKHFSQPIINFDTKEIYANTKECVAKLQVSKATIFNWLCEKHKPKFRLKRIKNKSELRRVMKQLSIV